MHDEVVTELVGYIRMEQCETEWDNATHAEKSMGPDTRKNKVRTPRDESAAPGSKGSCQGITGLDCFPELCSAIWDRI